ncbi:hypothetical protein, partial [Burkholderia sp.]|uniref:hypothetical protein n=1 Tax=Burkholderia sp. TaxID=36773 RepID=UPI00258B4B52
MVMMVRRENGRTAARKKGCEAGALIRKTVLSRKPRAHRHPAVWPAARRVAACIGRTAGAGIF